MWENCSHKWPTACCSVEIKKKKKMLGRKCKKIYHWGLRCTQSFVTLSRGTKQKKKKKKKKKKEQIICSTMIIFYHHAKISIGIGCR